jgi:hypothetical protein
MGAGARRFIRLDGRGAGGHGLFLHQLSSVGP